MTHLLVNDGRAHQGAVGIMRSLATMMEDAITDEQAESNPFRGVGAKIRASDPRIRKQPVPKRVWTFDQMHAFARAGGRWEPMIRVFSDTGMRLGEVIPLAVADWTGDELQVRRTAHEGMVIDGTKTDHGKPDAGRVVPCPPGLEALLRAMPRRIDSDLLLSDADRQALARTELLPRCLDTDSGALRHGHPPS